MCRAISPNYAVERATGRNHYCALDPSSVGGIDATVEIMKTLQIQCAQVSEKAALAQKLLQLHSSRPKSGLRLRQHKINEDSRWAGYQKHASEFDKTGEFKFMAILKVQWSIQRGLSNGTLCCFIDIVKRL